MNTDELKNLFERLKKDKKAMIILIIGLTGMLLIMFSGTGNDDKKQKISDEESNIYSEYELSLKIEELIESIEGAGKCKAMISYICYEETVYARNENESRRENSEKNYSGEYIIIDTGDKETGLVIKTVLPEIKGIAVVCTGGDNPIVRERIISTLSALFNISSNRISVAAMAK